MNDTCTWTQDESLEYYKTECGKAFYFNYEGPTEQEYLFCMFCGKKLVDVPYIEEEEVRSWDTRNE
jgi:hypothetical protein